jgi:hypothetical protein
MMTTTTTGGFGGTIDPVGGGGVGGTRCEGPGFIEVLGDGPDQVYSAAGPGQGQDVASGVLFQPKGGDVEMRARGCASNGSTNQCIELSGPGLDFAGATTFDARVEYTAQNGIVFVGDLNFMEVFDLGPVGGTINGQYDATVFASGGADQRSVFGTFAVCRLPDVAAP